MLLLIVIVTVCNAFSYSDVFPVDSKELLPKGEKDNDDIFKNKDKSLKQKRDSEKFKKIGSSKKRVTKVKKEVKQQAPRKQKKTNEVKPSRKVAIPKTAQPNKPELKQSKTLNVKRKQPIPLPKAMVGKKIVISKTNTNKNSTFKPKTLPKRTVKPLKHGMVGRRVSAAETNNKKLSGTVNGLYGKVGTKIGTKFNADVTYNPNKNFNMNTKVSRDFNKKSIGTTMNYTGKKLSTNSYFNFDKNNNQKSGSMGINAKYQANKNVTLTGAVNTQNVNGKRTSDLSLGANYAGTKFNGNVDFNKKWDPMGQSSNFKYNAQYQPNKNWTFGIDGSRENMYGQKTNKFNAKAGFVGEQKLKEANLGYSRTTDPNGLSTNLHYDAKYKPDDKWTLGVNGDFAKKYGQKTNTFNANAAFSHKKMEADVAYNRIKDSQGTSQTLSGKFNYKPTQNWTITGDGKLSNQYGQRTNEFNANANYKGTKTTGNIGFGLKHDPRGSNNYIKGDFNRKAGLNWTLSGNGKISNEYGERKTDFNGKAVFAGDKLQANVGLGRKTDKMGSNGYIDGGFSYKADKHWSFDGKGKVANQYGQKSNEFGIGAQYTAPKLNASASYSHANNANGKINKFGVNGRYAFNEKTAMTGNFQTGSNNGKRTTDYGIGIQHKPNKNTTLSADFKHNGITNSNTFGLGAEIKNDKLNLGANAEFGRDSKKAELSVGYKPSDKWEVQGKGSYSNVNGQSDTSYGVGIHYTPDEHWDVNAEFKKSLNEGSGFDVSATRKINDRSSFSLELGKNEKQGAHVMAGYQLRF